VALDALEAHWRAGRIGDATMSACRCSRRRRPQPWSATPHAARPRPKAPPRGQLRDDERYAVLALLRHVVRLLVPLLDNKIARDVLAAGLADLEAETGEEATQAIAELAHDLDDLPHASDPSPHHR
jgi:hypothetical protein